MTTELLHAYLRNHPLFAGVEKDGMDDAAALLKIRNVYKGEIINYGINDSSKLFLLVQGKENFPVF